MLLVLALWFEYVETLALTIFCTISVPVKTGKSSGDPVLPVFCVIPKNGGTPILQIFARVGGNKDQTH